MKKIKIITCPKCQKSYESDNNLTAIILYPDEIKCVFCGYTWKDKK